MIIQNFQYLNNLLSDYFANLRILRPSRSIADIERGLYCTYKYTCQNKFIQYECVLRSVQSRPWRGRRRGRREAADARPTRSDRRVVEFIVGAADWASICSTSLKLVTELYCIGIFNVSLPFRHRSRAADASGAITRPRSDHSPNRPRHGRLCTDL